MSFLFYLRLLFFVIIVNIFRSEYNINNYDFLLEEKFIIDFISSQARNFVCNRELVSRSELIEEVFARKFNNLINYA